MKLENINEVIVLVDEQTRQVSEFVAVLGFLFCGTVW